MPTNTDRKPASVADYVRTAIDRAQGRSMVMAAGGVVASEHPLASQAGAAVLAHGGHAVDAAIAANAAMGVVAPMMNGIGGDLFAIVYDAGSGELIGINGSGFSPAGLTIDRLRARGAFSSLVGGGQAVMRHTQAAVNCGASDPRKGRRRDTGILLSLRRLRCA